MAPLRSFNANSSFIDCFTKPREKKKKESLQRLKCPWVLFGWLLPSGSWPKKGDKNSSGLNIAHQKYNRN